MKAPKQIKHGARIHYDGPDREWLEHQYLTLNKSTVDISQEFGISRHAVAKWLRDNDIAKPKEQIWANHSKRMSGSGNPAWNGGTDRKYQKRTLRKSGVPYRCEWCGHMKRLEVHHHDHDPTNGDVSNLAWMCHPCNMLEAHLRMLQQSGRANVLMETNKIEIHFVGGE